MKELEEKILEIMKIAFQTDAVDKTSSQKTCEAWDSLHHLDMMVELECEFGISFEPEEVASMVNFDQVVKTIEKKLNHASE